MKVFARQISPEHQESPMMWCGDEMYKDVIFIGNRRYISRNVELYDDVKNALNDINDCFGWHKEGKKNEYCCFPSPLHKEKFSNSELGKWVKLSRAYFEPNLKESYWEENIFCEALRLLTGQKYDHTTIRGCSQSDWQNIFYPIARYSDKAIRCLEMDYFNLGSEWIVYDSDGEPESPEHVHGYTDYCYSWKDDELKQEILGHLGLSSLGSGSLSEATVSAEVVLYKYDGYTKVPKYIVA